MHPAIVNSRGSIILGELQAWARHSCAPRFQAALFFSALAVLGYSAAAKGDDPCGGVLMANRTLGTKEHKALVQKLGFYQIDGGLVMDGKSTCTSIHIE